MSYSCQCHVLPSPPIYNPSVPQMVERNYKFYLSFENSHCDEYITEKLYNVMSMDIVPVVMGGANYSHALPPHSYIDASDFENPRELAAYLMKLHADDALYYEFFRWKTDWVCRPYSQEFLCDLCAYSSDNRWRRQQLDSIEHFFSPQSECRTKEQFLSGHI